MNSSDQNPKLPTWLFIVTDLALVGAAAFVASRSSYPLSPSAIVAIVGAVMLGAVVAFVPIVAKYERQKNETLDDRQRALEALARTVSTSAEQISIAAGGLHEIAEIAQKNLRQAEHLPHKLQEKIAEFQAQLATAVDADKEELERELLALRTTESERLESVSQRIAKSTAEWTKLEAATHQHLTAANQAVAQLSQATVTAIAKAQAAAELALSQARVEVTQTLATAGRQATHAIEAAKSTALADLDTRLATATAAMVERVAAELGVKLSAATQALEAKVAQLEAAARKFEAPRVVAVEAEAKASVTPPPTPVAVEPPPEPSVPSETPAPSVSGEEPAPTADLAPLPPKRTRKPRREEPVAAEPSVTEPVSPAAIVLGAEAAPETPVSTAPAPSEPTEVRVEEPAPIPVDRIAEIAPVTPTTVEPFPDATAPERPIPVDVSPAVPAVPPDPVSVVEPAKPSRRRAPEMKPEVDEESGLSLDLDDSPVATSASMAERVLTSDGATRLLVTAYIGIGNRLFVRGEGPGLSWEKGVPLQFVSIGKWRWETNDASGPVQFKLYKNDEIECTALGIQHLDPGHLQEVSATF